LIFSLPIFQVAPRGDAKKISAIERGSIPAKERGQLLEP